MSVSRETLKTGAAVELTVTGYTAEGAGVGRVDRQVVFVPRAIAGERLRVRIVNVGKTAAHGEILDVLEPSPHRIAPDCPYFGRCGGCDFRHMDYDEELRLKKQRVLDALSRLGGVTLADLPITGAGLLDGYRNKVQYPVQPRGRAAVAGFFRPRTHEVIPIETCRIQPPCADELRRAVLRWMADHKVAAYNEKSHTGVVRHIYLRRGWVSGAVLLCVVLNAEKTPHADKLAAAVRAACPEVTGVVASYNTRRGNSVLGSRFETLWGDGALRDTLCGLEFSLSPAAFYQVNHDQAERLYEKALAFAALDKTQTALDLYCGAGTITLCLAWRAGKVYGVEIVPEAVTNARENAARNGVTNAEFFCADAGAAALEFAKRGEKLDAIVVDPPRKGLSADVIEALAQMSPERIVYVSCDPATLARDVRELRTRGYALSKAEAVDLFPRCAHIETVCLLERAGFDEKE